MFIFRKPGTAIINLYQNSLSAVPVIEMNYQFIHSKSHPQITKNIMIDFIGDVHGHADKLEALLGKMGYINKNDTYSHPGRKALFVGDYIDRGPQIKETLQIVRRMVETDNAIALMGNHEYNALCFHYKESEGGHLRKHLIKNVIQHFKTLEQFQNQQELYEEYLKWFTTLPLFYETDKFRAVHACWDNKKINYLQSVLNNGRLNDNLIRQSVVKETELHIAIENILKGKEITMPAGLGFQDKDGTVRTEIRIKWWENPVGATYKNISIERLDMLPETTLATEDLNDTNFYNDPKPVFFGHYWLKGNPILYNDKICCLDYSVAKNGHLVSYRFDGEDKLDNSKLIFV